MKKKKEKVIDKNMTFAKILDISPELYVFFLKKGLHCIGCPMSAQETLEEGAMMHGLDPEKLIKEINKLVNKK